MSLFLAGLLVGGLVTLLLEHRVYPWVAHLWALHRRRRLFRGR